VNVEFVLIHIVFVYMSFTMKIDETYLFIGIRIDFV